MRKLIASEWMSLDGVFDASTMNDWFNPFDSSERQAFIRDGILACDAMLFGRTTYEMLASYWSAMTKNEMGIADKINSVPKYVVSTSLKKADWNNTTIIRNNVVDAITTLKTQPGRDVQIPGSAKLVRSLIDSSLLDELQFLVQPIIAGKGERFFNDGMHTGSMTLVDTKTLPSGVIVLRYQPAKS